MDTHLAGMAEAVSKQFSSSKFSHRFREHVANWSRFLIKSRWFRCWFCDESRSLTLMKCEVLGFRLWWLIARLWIAPWEVWPLMVIADNGVWVVESTTFMAVRWSHRKHPAIWLVWISENFQTSNFLSHFIHLQKTFHFILRTKFWQWKGRQIASTKFHN